MAKSRNFTITDLRPELQDQVRRKFKEQLTRNGEQLLDAVSKPTKYRNKKTLYRSTQGFERTYDSKWEADYAIALDRGISGCLIKWWLPQVSIPLPGGVIYRLDFLVMYANGRLVFVDTKGRDTQGSVNKRKQVKSQFGIDVEIVRR